jgi:hypothetical protein
MKCKVNQFASMRCGTFAVISDRPSLSSSNRLGLHSVRTSTGISDILTEVFRSIPLSLLANCGIVYLLGHGRFILYAFQIVIHLYSLPY